MALGLHSAAFDHLSLVEWEARACDTIYYNAIKPEAPWAAQIVSRMDVRDYVRELPASESAGVDLVAGGPPCQPSSLGGLHAGSRRLVPISRLTYSSPG